MKTERMQQRETTTSVTLGIAAMTLSLFLTGCGTDGIGGAALTAPEISSNGIITIIDVSDGSNSGGGSPDEATAPVGGGNPTPAASAGVAALVTGEVTEVSAVISKSGGTIVAGRHTLRILPNTFSSPTQVTLRDLTGMSGRVECEVLPAGLGLGKRAFLTSNFADLAAPSGCALFEVRNADAIDESWHPVQSSVSGQQGVTGRIGSFAHYAPSASSAD